MGGGGAMRTPEPIRAPPTEETGVRMCLGCWLQRRDWAVTWMVAVMAVQVLPLHRFQEVQHRPVGGCAAWVHRVKCGLPFIRQAGGLSPGVVTDHAPPLACH